VQAPEGIVRRRRIGMPGLATALRSARLFVLTSERTASGGEGFALAMKRSGRATPVGEVKAGAERFGRTQSLGGGYRAFIPVDQPFDPATGKGWELVGVERRVRVPSDKALEEAARLAGLTR
jgi:C-terminal processing protease CtpA/Prc